MGYLLVLSVVGTYIFINFVQPYLDVMYEVYKNERTFELEKQQLKLQSQKYDLMRKYPEMYNESTDNVVGFQYEEPRKEYYNDGDDEWEWDEEEVEDKGIHSKVKNKIGY